MESTLSQRLRELMKVYGLLQIEFADSVGISRATLHNILNNNKSPDFHTIEKISQAYPLLNIRWLITGAGEMLTGPKSYSQLQETYNLLSEEVENYKSENKKLMNKVIDLQDQMLKQKTDPK